MTSLSFVQRKLYAANAGDARAVLWYVGCIMCDIRRIPLFTQILFLNTNSRSGEAVRLTRDHKVWRFARLSQMMHHFYRPQGLGCGRD